MVPPYSASLHRLRHPMFEFVLLLVMFVFLFYNCYHFCPSISAFPRVSCVVLAPPAEHKNVCFFELCVAALFFSFLFFSFFLAFSLVLSCRPSVGPSPRHIIGLIQPANSNLFPPGIACALHACMKFLFRFSFLSVPVFFFAPFCPFLPFIVKPSFLVLLFGCTHVPWLCSWCYLAAADAGSCTTGRYSVAPFVHWYCSACNYHVCFLPSKRLW